MIKQSILGTEVSRAKPRSLVLCLLVLCLAFWVVPLAIAQEKSSSAGNTNGRQIQIAGFVSQSAFSAEDQVKETLVLSEQSAAPLNLDLQALDSSVFLYNGTDSTPLNLEVDFGKNRMHCHSDNLKLQEDGKMVTTSPIPAGDFVVLCFPQEGTYRYKASGKDGFSLDGVIKVYDKKS